MIITDSKIQDPILHLVGEEADKLQLECYVIGGWVRDLFLHRESKDIDIVVVGSGIALAEAVTKRLGRSRKTKVIRGSRKQDNFLPVFLLDHDHLQQRWH